MVIRRWLLYGVHAVALGRLCLSAGLDIGQLAQDTGGDVCLSTDALSRIAATWQLCAGDGHRTLCPVVSQHS